MLVHLEMNEKDNYISQYIFNIHEIQSKLKIFLTFDCVVFPCYSP